MGGRAYIPAAANEHWNTSQRDVELVLETFEGRIDTDPCSNAGSLVPAKHRYTVEDNGLAQPWYGRVYVNPPYGRQSIWWVLTALLELRLKRATEVIFLVPARVDTRWWEAGAMQARSICVPRGRRTFEGASAGAPFPVAFIYLGNHVGEGRFERVFGNEGSFWRPTVRQRLAARERELMLLSMADASETIPPAQSSSPFSSLLHGLTQQFLFAFYDEIKHLTVEEAVRIVASSFIDGYEQGSAKSQGEPFAERMIARKGEEAKAAAAAKAKPKPKAKSDVKAKPEPEPTTTEEPKKKAPKKKAPPKPEKKTTPKSKTAAKGKKAPPKPKTAAKGKKKVDDSASTGRTSATQVLDEVVREQVVDLCAEQGEVRLGDLLERLVDYSDQQIGRSLARSVEAGLIERQGATKNTVYKAV